MRLRLWLSVLVALTLAGCGDPGGETLDSIEARQEVADADWGYTTVQELLDSMGETAANDQHAQMVIVATVESVDPISSARWEFDEEDDSDIRIDLPYGHEQSWSDIYHLTINPVETLAVAQGWRANSPALTVGLVLEPGLAPEQVETDLQDLGDVVLLLEDDSPVFTDNEEVLSIVQDGAGIGLIDNDGKVTFVSDDAQ
ncbi:MAG: hypothetical protein WBG57_07430, partial [Ornithinimicrobium sp.]